MLVKLNGNMFAKHCGPATFCFGKKKFGDIDPRCQFRQRPARSFYACGCQQGKKILMT